MRRSVPIVLLLAGLAPPGVALAQEAPPQSSDPAHAQDQPQNAAPAGSTPDRALPFPDELLDTLSPAELEALRELEYLDRNLVSAPLRGGITTGRPAFGSVRWGDLVEYWSNRNYFADTIPHPGTVRTLSYRADDGSIRAIRNINEFPGFDNLFIQGRRNAYDHGRFGLYTGGYPYSYGHYNIGGSRSTYIYPPLLERPHLIDWDIFLAQPTPPPVDEPDPGLEAIAEGAWNRAAAVYLKRDQDRDEDARERGNLRIAAVLFALDGQIERAARDLERALEDDPGLIDDPIDHEALGLEYSDLANTQSRVARRATRSGDPALWALAATLADARGSGTAPRVWDRYNRALAAD